MTLSPKARELLEASRKVLRPSAADRDRIEGVLRSRLGEGAFPESGSIARPSNVASWPSVASVVAGVCVVAGATIFALRDTPEPRREAPQERPVPAVLETPPADVVIPDLVSQPSAAGSPARAAQTPRGRHVHDPLAREVALLSRATRELRAGRAAAALATLDKHTREFPKGRLREERLAARAQALCALGRVREGLAELSSLDPHSPMAAHARQLCEGSSRTREF